MQTHMKTSFRGPVMHQKFDNHPIPNKPLLFANDLTLVDPNRFESWAVADKALQELDKDITRVFLPMDLNLGLIMSRLRQVYDMMGPVDDW